MGRVQEGPADLEQGACGNVCNAYSVSGPVAINTNPFKHAHTFAHDTLARPTDNDAQTETTKTGVPCKMLASSADMGNSSSANFHCRFSGGINRTSIYSPKTSIG